MQYKIIKMKKISDERGSLIALESLKDLPFSFKRIYYIFDTSPDFNRGGHAHTRLEQALIMMDGSCEIFLDNGKESKTLLLNRPDEALYIGKNMWREMKNFSYGAKLLVLASDFYDESEYIREYSSFLRSLK